MSTAPQNPNADARSQTSRPNPAQGPAHDLPKFVELVEGARTCMFTTVDEDGSLVSRPMAVQAVDPDGTVWFFAFSDAPKIAQIESNAEVNLSFGQDDTWVSASGTAVLVEDDAKKRELWNPFATAWFQCEPEDEIVSLIRVDTTSGEYWDSPGKAIALFGVLKALTVGGEPIDGDNAKLDLAE